MIIIWSQEQATAYAQFVRPKDQALRFIIYFCTYYYTNVSSTEIHLYMYNVSIAAMSFFNKQSLWSSRVLGQTCDPQIDELSIAIH